MNQVETAVVAPVEEEKTLELRKPVKLGEVEYSTLNLREPTAGELSKASKAGGNVDIAIALISLIAKVPRGAVEKLSQRDFQEAADFLGSFTGGGLATGEM
ncbi:hypothetical protein JAB5_01430 [Janthinobacterium sp. HH103]|uniref:phage tail assembly protein n=1 Tax=unclassified Janthinobacterium TaxID=2610881 RepID=UPI000874D2DE|nr:MULTISPECIES: phage tail assembly protein [unclassified Janthinobacterium]OEZ73172.1 hypothetical protein JAB2_01000 [Janthinobacterium sp. HH100]OEZ73223.1 hypothetical protein JAB2_01510 [Janthinobacterium sp. HH100]OEZ88891.1 hypothetical protein JAB5_01430 [Janthinobacterium sp. HH103]QOU75432.1 Phage tail assembly chaperone protein, E, or 41 or 14 [Janthinobacterium sp. HH102]